MKNVTDAIEKANLVRLRSGSPGLRAGSPKEKLADGQTFQKEMHKHGMSNDL